MGDLALGEGMKPVGCLVAAVHGPFRRPITYPPSTKVTLSLQTKFSQDNGDPYAFTISSIGGPS